MDLTRPTARPCALIETWYGTFLFYSTNEGGNGKFEITLNSDRPATKTEPVFGGQDAYLARAVFLPYWWSKPVNAGPNVNTAGNETRASLSWDGKRLYVGRGDVYVSERQ